MVIVIFGRTFSTYAKISSDLELHGQITWVLQNYFVPISLFFSGLVRYGTQKLNLLKTRRVLIFFYEGNSDLESVDNFAAAFQYS